ncbi:unnamed protein product [Pedinophyceae sp. YPF-701]|nr:unnamed protein product [Pedinophyceae sp. YPF-701]
MNCVLSGKPLVAAKGLAGRRAAPAARARVVMAAESKGEFDPEFINRKDTFPLGAAFLGWTIPSTIPVSGFDGNSLFGLFTASIGENLAKFPTGPALNDKFWLYMITWHIGLFTVMTLGKIGIEGRKQKYW